MPRTLPVLAIAPLVVLALLAAAGPAMALVVPTQQTLVFDEPATAHLGVTVRFSGSDAQQLRALVFNHDHDRNVTQGEVHDSEADLQRLFHPNDLPRLDGAAPSNMTFDPFGIEGAVGPVNADTPVLIHLHVTLTFTVEPVPHHLLEIHRPAGVAGPAGSPTSFDMGLVAPPGYRFDDPQGFPGTMDLSADHTSYSGTMPVASPDTELSIGFAPLNAEWSGTSTPGPELPVLALGLAAAGLAAARRRGR